MGSSLRRCGSLRCCTWELKRELWASRLVALLLSAPPTVDCGAFWINRISGGPGGPVSGAVGLCLVGCGSVCSAGLRRLRLCERAALDFAGNDSWRVSVATTLGLDLRDVAAFLIAGGRAPCWAETDRGAACGGAGRGLTMCGGIYAASLERLSYIHETGRGIGVPCPLCAGW